MPSPVNNPFKITRWLAVTAIALLSLGSVSAADETDGMPALSKKVYVAVLNQPNEVWVKNPDFMAAFAKTDMSEVALLEAKQKFALAYSSGPMTIAKSRILIPELAGLDDARAFNIIHQAYYPDMDKVELAKRLSYVLKAPASRSSPDVGSRIALDLSGFDALDAAGIGRGYKPVVAEKPAEKGTGVGDFLNATGGIAVIAALIGGIWLLQKRSGATYTSKSKLRGSIAPVHSVDASMAPDKAIPDWAFVAIVNTLRLFRGFAGLVGGWQIVGLLPVLSWVGNYAAVGATDLGTMIAVVALKLVVTLICFGIFFGLRFAVNKLYFKRHGVQHPVLTKKWRL